MRSEAPSTAGALPAPIYIAGPTASGKSAVAMALARLLPLEIISVDSAQVYEGMDIGTAKPDAAEQAAVPHHLIDIRTPLQRYSAAEFAADARRLIAAIQARGRHPVLVGGTMLYFRALFQGLDTLPSADPAIRAQLDAEAAARGWPALHAELARVDPATAARLAPADKQRIQRALEVWRQTGRPISALQTQGAGAAIPTPAHFFALQPVDRAWLHQRIAMRFQAMLAAGFVAEVEHIQARWHPAADQPSMRCVGYRQALDVLQGRAPMAELTERGAAATRQLAKRQLTWLRRMPGKCVLAVDENSDARTLATHIVQRLRTGEEAR